MLINIIFLILYILLSGYISGSELYFLFSFHLVLYILDSFRKKMPVTPITLFAVGAIIVNIANIKLIGQMETGQISTYSYLIPQYIDDAAVIWCISSTLVIMGFSFINKGFPSIGFDVKKQHLKPIFTTLIFLNLIVIFTHGLNLKGSLKIFGLLNTIGILFFARLWAKEDNKTYRTYAITLLLLETYVALTTSFLRFELIFPTVCLFIGYFVGKGDIKYLFSYRILPYIFIGILYASIFSSLQSNRSNFIGVFSNDDNLREQETENKKPDALLIRSANLAQITNVVKLVRQNGFYDGRASSPLIIALIPRIFWPEKPNIQLGAWFALAIGRAYQDESGFINNSINMTVSGELYLDFGWFGVAIGSVLLGMFLAALWNATKFYSSEYNLIGTIMGGYLFIILFIGIAADLQIVISLSSLYLTFFIIKKAAKSVL